ncbi:hypothetical protein BBB39_10810 [Bordetella trematum]|uniref:Flagellar hook-length control protein FliK n=1 Tax=Bordetella trematum TaxID=123899 RepID=A0A157SQW6_9BORD|nr:flagellar hook-length control protein FliK [Bordetella trematum]AZR94215.1 hypothetical protein BBB39_10810 [Bordetella trematum]NNH21384.1 flagellar hook-length control protein FliK [Bordetella trematum]SAH74696.1 Flagellar hook-length control protein FliK [Bordetella trematum]SAI72850.1 Flagellar hook-length control protein FliK [Bordetella trematum]SUV97599.1 Flagellar hook-length control protein FliK [Bordetella trematum]
MSVGPPALGNVLVQRLDAVLGTTMAAHANLVTGARPDAVSRPGEAARPGQSEHATRGPRQADAQGLRSERQAPALDARSAALLASRLLVTRQDSTASAPTTLGGTARVILALLAQYPETAPPAQGRTPLWTPPAGTTAQAGATQLANARVAASGPGVQPAGAAVMARPDAPHFAQALRQSLENSGLFYESHLSDLAFGKRTPDSLRAEPQARLPQPPPMPLTTPTAAAARKDPPTLPPPGGSAVSLSPAASSPEAAPTAAGTPVPGVHPESNALVRQQLEILANQVIQWQGQPWPGAEMEWEVRRDPYGEAPEDPDSHWSTRLTLRLPQLGEVQARLTLAGQQVVLQLIAPQSAVLLDAHAPALRQSLDAAGLAVGSLTVQTEAPRPFLTTDYSFLDP